jgi:cell wall assembly regulator SMI1
MGAVTEAWERIEGWMARYAPDSAALLAPPARKEDVRAAEEATGLAFPPELVESLLRHDGLLEWANIFPGKPPLPVAKIVAHWEMCCGEMEEDEDEFLEEGDEPWWHPLWLPFAGSDGDSQIIDLRPGPGFGRLGSAVHDDAGSFVDAWPSLGAYLTETADALETGGAVRVWRPYLIADRELWWTFAGETELHGRPLQPVLPS